MDSLRAKNASEKFSRLGTFKVGGGGGGGRLVRVKKLTNNKIYLGKFKKTKKRIKKQNINN
jgi:hypothetical protein